MNTHQPEDRCRPFGIPRPELPPDDIITETQAWVAGEFDGLAAVVMNWKPRVQR